MPLDQNHLLELCTREMMFANPSFLNIELAAESALALLGALQLSLRHPLIGDAARSMLTQIADAIETQLSNLGPATRELCGRGWDVRNDPPVDAA
jgi:hypothetical protein